MLRDAMSQASGGCQMYKPLHGTLSFSWDTTMEMAQLVLQPGEGISACKPTQMVKIKERCCQ
jgi:hypothetical protein